MSTNQVSSGSQPNPQAAAPQSANAVRQAILWGLLALVIAAYAYDYFVARPGADAAEQKIQEFVDARNKLGVKDSAMVSPKDIHEALGMTPTLVEKHEKEQYEVEYYCWWGPVPFINTRRHFISIVYNGEEPNLRFGSHHRNSTPPPEALPIEPSTPAADGQTLPSPVSADGGQSPPAKEGEGAAKGEEQAKTEAKSPDTESPKAKEQ